MQHSRAGRRLSGGVEPRDDGSLDVRVWAPACTSIDLVLDADRARIHPLARMEDGFFEAQLAGVGAGERYWFRIDGDRLRPDPVSRAQPDGPHGPSAVIDPDAFAWSDAGWLGVGRDGQVIYELHVGTFTREGTWAAAAEQLPELVRLGITIVEMMPIADFAGTFGWGYDGVNLYAPTRLYGTVDDLRRFIDRAHAEGLGVILDVVYNHLGPDGNYLNDYSTDYFTDKYTNDWGRAINFEGPAPARDFFVENAGYWIDEYHFDGLRLDATQDIKDASREHVIASLVQRARRVAGARRIFVVAENEPQHTRLVRRPERGGYDVDALWNDDYHHAAVVALTGRREAYYADYAGTANELVATAKYGYLFQGQWYAWQKQPRGTPSTDLPGAAFVTFLENHDQVANSAFGKRLHQRASPGRYRALTALTLLGPGTPMLFQGQEFASSAPFLFFADHGGELGEAIRTGRREFLAQFPSNADPEIQAVLPPPGEIATFERCKLDLAERERHAETLTLHRDLLALRRDDPAIASAATEGIDGAALSPTLLVLRYGLGTDEERLLIINLSADAQPSFLSEPLLAPPYANRWRLQWSSESVRYGGTGRVGLDTDPSRQFPGEAAILLRAEPLPAGTRVEADGH